jgi:hypothetical protein
MGIHRLHSVPLLVKDLGGEASDALGNDCRLSRRAPPSSSQLVPCTLMRVRALMMLVFRASKNWPIVGLLLEPWYQQIAPNVFSRGSWFRFWVMVHSVHCFSVRCWIYLFIFHPFCCKWNVLNLQALLRNVLIMDMSEVILNSVPKKVHTTKYEHLHYKRSGCKIILANCWLTGGGGAVLWWQNFLPIVLLALAAAIWYQ